MDVRGRGDEGRTSLNGVWNSIELRWSQVGLGDGSTGDSIVAGSVGGSTEGRGGDPDASRLLLLNLVVDGSRLLHETLSPITLFLIPDPSSRL